MMKGNLSPKVFKIISIARYYSNNNFLNVCLVSHVSPCSITNMSKK